MSDMHPLVLCAIARESLGALFWPAVVLVLLLGLGMLLAIIRAARRGRGLRRGLLTALVVGAVVTALITPLVPTWTHAALSDLRSLVDIAVALGLAAIPGVLAASLAFIVATFIGAARA